MKSGIVFALLLSLAFFTSKAQLSQQDFTKGICKYAWIADYSIYNGKYQPINARNYSVYYEQGSGVVKRIADDSIQFFFDWKYTPSKREIMTTFKSQSTEHSQRRKLIILSEDILKVDEVRDEWTLRIVYKPWQGKLNRLIPEGNVKNDNPENWSLIKVPLSEIANTVKVSAYFPYRYHVTSHLIDNDMIYFGTDGAGLISYDSRKKKWDILNHVNSRIPVSIALVKSDREGGLFLESERLLQFGRMDTLCYMLFKDRKEMEQLTLVGFDRQNNLGVATEYKLLLIDSQGTVQRTSVIESQEDKVRNVVYYKVPFKAAEDSRQIRAYKERALTGISSDTLVTVFFRQQCRGNEFIYAYEEYPNIFQMKSCRCEFKEGKWSFEKISLNVRPYLPFKPRPRIQYTGLVGVDTSAQINGLPYMYEANNRFELFRKTSFFTIFEKLGIFLYDQNTGKYNVPVKYKFIKLEEILNNKKLSQNIWPLVDENNLKRELHLFKFTTDFYGGKDKRWGKEDHYYANDSGVELRFAENAIEVIEGVNHRKIVLSEGLPTPEYAAYSGVEFHFPFIWIIHEKDLIRIRIDKNFQFIDRISYVLDGNSNGLKQVDNKLLIFKSGGLEVINLEDLHK